MAIGARTAPEVIVSGPVQNIRERRTRDDNRLYAYQVEIQTDGGGLNVQYWVRENEPPPRVPSPGLFVAVVGSVSEGQRGADLNYVRDVNEDDVDRLHSQLSVAAGK